MSTGTLDLKKLMAARKAASAQTSGAQEHVNQAATVVPIQKESMPVVEIPRPELPQAAAVLENEPARAESSTHPLAMQLAELRQQLESRIPGFATILRDIHTKLRADPTTVTLMSEDEIYLVVKGLRTHSNIEIVAPAKVKSAVKLARTTHITASDL